MNNPGLSANEQERVRLAMTYWREHWDWECTTLFGIELAELEEVIQFWPRANATSREAQALAVVGSLRELLYGASTPPREQLHAILGIGYVEASALCTKACQLYGEK
jgi:hypothetical protein